MLDSGAIVAVAIPVGFILFYAAYVYAAYWALAIRKGLVIAAYRKQALLVSSPVLSLLLVAASIGFLPVTQDSPNPPIIVNAIADLSLLAVLMYWVNVTVSLARRSDPFERDSLHFSTTRFIWLLAVAIPVAVELFYNPIAAVFTVAVPLTPLYIGLSIAPWAIFGSFGAILLFVSAQRSKDMTLQGHVRWFGFFTVVLLGIQLIGSLWRAAGGNSGLPVYFFFVFIGGQLISAYCLYRSAKSLAPITKTL